MCIILYLTMSIDLPLICSAIILIKHCVSCIICAFSVTNIITFLVTKPSPNERLTEGLRKNEDGA